MMAMPKARAEAYLYLGRISAQAAAERPLIIISGDENKMEL